MTNKVLNNSTISVEKLRTTLQDLTERLSNRGALSEIIGESLRAFKAFYTDIGQPSFTPHYLETGDTPNSEVYNLNFSQINDDLARFYSAVDKLASAQIQSFNYASIVNQELIKRADGLASIVLDLKILSDFTRGDVIVAGDDFRTLDNVDEGVATASPKAEKMFGVGGMSLRRTSNRNLVDENTEIDIFPVAPAKEAGAQVNVDPTPGNLERFYEGLYYGFVNQARPEGGIFNIKYVLRPEEIKEDSDGFKTTTENKPNDLKGTDTRTIIDDSERFSNSEAGFFVEIGATESQKERKRLLMFDEDPSTFWEAEYVYHIPQPLISNIIDEASIEEDNNNEGLHKDDIPRTTTVVIDFNEAERAAKAFDFDGRDLILEIVATFPEPVPVNYVVFDPILFGSTSFPEILEISTATEEEGQFRLVDGWDANKFAKTITPEANEFLNDVQVGQLLSPTRFEYTGKGVFPFPSRISKKIRIRAKMDNPVPAIYERYYILMRNQLDIETEIVTKTTKGRLRF